MPLPSRSISAIFSSPTITLVFVGSLIGRLAYGTAPLSILLVVKSATGSFASAGAALAVFGLTAGLLGPFRGRLVDRFGIKKTLPTMAFGFAAPLVALAILASESRSWMGFLALSAFSGAFAPPLGPVMRVLWASTIEQPNVLRKAFSLDTVIEEIVYLVGPAAVGLLLAVLGRGQVLVVPAVCAIVGSVLVSILSMDLDQRSSIGSRDQTRRQSEPLPRYLLAVSVVVFGLGLSVGAIDVIVPSIGVAQNSSTLAGILLSVVAAGSAIGGAAYGAARRTWSPPRDLLIFGLAVASATMLLSLVRSTAYMFPALFFLGLCISPALIAAYLMVQEGSPKDRATEATTWVNTSHNLAAALGGALGGVLVQGRGSSSAFFICGAVAIVAVAVGRVGMNRCKVYRRDDDHAIAGEI